MPKVRTENINTPEHYNRIFKDRDFEIDYSQPLREGYLVGKFQGGKFLDVGCGVSTCCQLALQKSNDVWGVDFSDQLIQALRYRYPEVNYVVADLNDLPFKARLFDYITMGEVLEHTEDPYKVIENIVKILKPKGRLAISVPFNKGKEETIPEHIWNFTEQEMKDLLSPYGEVEVHPNSEGRNMYLFAFLQL